MQSNVPSAVVMRAMPSIEIVRVAVPWSRAVPLSINTVCMDDSLRSGAFDFTKHSSSIRQNCDAFYVVRGAQGTTQRVECMDQRHGPKQDFTIMLSEQNHFPLLPPWEGGAP